MLKNIIQVSLTFVMLFFCDRLAVACSCVSTPSPCESFQSTPVVFVGLVQSIEEDIIEVQRFGRMEKVRTGLTAHFVVEEALKGISDKQVDVITSGNSAACGYPFRAGERYLVYAHRSEREALDSSISRTEIGGGTNNPPKRNSLSTSICSRTMPLSEAHEDLDLIRALLKGRPQTRIFGTVHEYISKLGDISSFDKTSRYEPKAGMTIIVEGNAAKHETSTDSEGRFRLNDLKPGKYKLRIVLPAAYGMNYSFERSEIDVEVTAGCWSEEVNFTVRVDGRISGRVHDAQGKPVGKSVRVSIIEYDSTGKDQRPVESRNEYTNEEGRYEFDGVPAGRYVLGVNIADVPNKDTPYAKTYFPAGTTIAQAAVINLAAGQKLSELDFRMPPALEEVTVTGIVLTKDGKPAAEASVALYDIENPDKPVWKADADTDKEGRFSVKGHRGRRYRIRAFLSEDYLAGTGSQSEMLEVDTGNASPYIKIILSKPGIFMDRDK